MLKDFLKAYAVAVLVAAIMTTALWIVGAAQPCCKLVAIALSFSAGVPLATAYIAFKK